MSALDEQTTAPDSPLAGLRKAYAKRRKAAELYLPVPGWDEPRLIARIAVPSPDFLERVTADLGTPEWMAEFVAETVTGLYEPDGIDDAGDAKVKPIVGHDGAPLRFDANFGSAIGEPAIDTPQAAVIAAFTTGGEGSYPTLNLLALGEFADRIERWLSDTSRSIAGAIVPGR